MELYCVESKISKSIEKDAKDVCDDLLRKDQKEMPMLDRFETLIPDNMIGDALIVMDFINNFANKICEFVDSFHEINFYEITRALTAPELDGPLFDIILMLLRTVFVLQEKEEHICKCSYRSRYDTSEFKISATHTHYIVKRFYCCKINELPLDLLDLSEVLRLHLLSSGASVDEKCQNSYLNNRAGYTTAEDPGLHFCINYPHIISSLRFQTVFEMPMREVLDILLCLISQILTYSTIVKYNDEQRKIMFKKKAAILQKENKINPEMLKTNLAFNVHGDPTMVVVNFYTEILNESICLGTDRAYRKYYITKNIPGILVEHSIESEVCLKSKVSHFTKTQFDTLMMCSGEKSHESCTVHNKFHPKYQQWSYLYQHSKINALVESLNPLGERERQLLQQFKIFLPAIIWQTKYLFQLFDTEKGFCHFNSKLLRAAKTKYGNAVSGKDLSEIIYHKVVDKILELESIVCRKKKNSRVLIKWRRNLCNGIYDPELVEVPFIPSRREKDIYVSSKTVLEYSSKKSNELVESSLYCLKSNLVQLLAYNDQNLKDIEYEVDKWKVSLMNSKSYSQVKYSIVLFLNLHFINFRLLCILMFSRLGFNEIFSVVLNYYFSFIYKQCIFNIYFQSFYA